MTETRTEIREDRKKELASMSDAWLHEMINLHQDMLSELLWERNRRQQPSVG